jgi:membrane-bound lytic murein transglycosylase D
VRNNGFPGPLIPGLGLILLTLFPRALGAGELSGDIPENPRASPELSESGRPLRQNRHAIPPRFTSHPEPEFSLAISGLEQPLTMRFIRQYSSPGGLAWLNAVMERGGPYLAFIRREIEKRKLPPELIYLPVIESAYSPRALSRSGAAGLWQFMKNSIAPFNIRVSDWMDERMDFWKSTEGALRKLEDNYRRFGDWPLALAAYNAGAGAVARAIRQAGIDDYWVLSEKKYLKNETIQYVPKFLAVSYMLSHPRQFGLTVNWPEDPQWTRIPVGKAVDLELLAEYAAINGGELKQANQELHYSVTPPDPDYQLKVRSGDAPAVAAVLERTDLVFIKYYFHTIRSGDTLSALSRHYGASVDQILSSNPGTQARYLKLGQRLRIPALKDVGPYQQPRNGGADLTFSAHHLVKRGETLWSIALAYNVDPQVLAEANGMDLNDILREGRTLKTPIRE